MGVDRTRTAESEMEAQATQRVLRMRVVYPPHLAGGSTVLGPRLKIGREAQPGPALALPHSTVSRAHAELELLKGGAVRVRDLDSHNGTWVNGERAGTLSAEVGGVLRFGEVLAVLDEHSPDDASKVSVEAIPGDCTLMRRLRAAVAQVAPLGAPVLVSGETGTGKERVSRELHRLSGRKGALVAINCGETSRELIASTLFGSEAGAFTGSAGAREGVIRSAANGTVMLDEIGELDVQSQVMLLRVLEEREVRPVGASRAVPVDVRFVAATNRDLRAEVEAGRFRRDLYARLALHEIDVPPLRARRGDILDWLERFAQGLDTRPFSPAWSATAAEMLLLHSWPSNLRGLLRLLQRLSLRPDLSAQIPSAAVEEIIAPERAAPAAPLAAPAVAVEPAAAPRTVRPTPTKDELRDLLALHGSVRAVAKALDRDRRQIYRWMETYGLKGD